MIKVEEALNIILNSIKNKLSSEEVPLEHALDRILQEDIFSDYFIPPFNNSAMDGYAVRAEDVKNASDDNLIRLKIVDDIPAGYVPQKKVGQNEASIIMTGAPVPEGADCVVIVEHTTLEKAEGGRQKAEENDKYVKIFVSGRVGDNIRLIGEDIKKGEKVLEKGTQLKPSDLGLLAGLGISKVKVSKKPVVSIISTGDELLDLDAPLAPGKIRCSNNYMLAGLVTKYGGISLNLGIAKDNKEDLIKYLEKGKAGDVIITTGGISVGKYDVVKDTLKSLGGEFKFWKVAMKPGKPLAFCIWDEKLVFGLPGNPISSFVSFEQFVRPALAKMCGKNDISPSVILATLENDITKKSGIRYFARCRVYIKNNEFVAEVVGPHGSNMLKPLTKSNGLIILKDEVTIAKKGDKVEVRLVDNL